MGSLFTAPSPYATAAPFDPTDVRWALGYRHPTVHATTSNNNPTPYPQVFQTTQATVQAVSYYEPGPAGIEPPGFCAAQTPVPTSTQASNPSVISGTSCICFGSPISDTVWDGTASTSKQMSDALSNRVLPNVPVFGPAAGLRGGLWEFSGSLWVDSQFNNINGVSYGWYLQVLASPFSTPSFPNAIGLGTTVGAAASVQNPGSVQSSSGTTTMSTAGGTAYKFSIAKIAYNSASTSSTYRVTMGGVIDSTIVTSLPFHGQLTLCFMNGSNTGTRPYRILDCRFRQLF